MATPVRTTITAAVLAVTALVVLLMFRPLDRTTAPSEDVGLQDGSVVVVDGDLQTGTVWFLWSGQRQRIQQPATFQADELEAAGLSIGAPAPERLTVASEGAPPSRFVIVPPDGADARLYVDIGGVLHEVQLLTADADEVFALPEAADLFITRIRIPPS